MRWLLIAAFDFERQIAFVKKAISPKTWEAINRRLIHFAKDEGIEKDRGVRIDCTVVEANIHAPSDSTLLWDSVIRTSLSKIDAIHFLVTKCASLVADQISLPIAPLN